MINNRQGGRRRGRGGGGGGGGRQQGGGPGPGNRQETRNRGNAAQLLEKYKSMARDAQMQGDRVQTEYYLQYAEHYYRVLNENRARFEEQRPQRGEFYEDDEDQDERGADGRDEGDDREERDERPYREDRPQRDERQHRDDRPTRDDRPDRHERAARPDRAERDFNGGGAAGGRSRPRRDRFEPTGDEGDERIALDVLPPAISTPSAAEPASDEPVKAPRRRGRRPRDEDDAEIAPAA